MQDETSIGGAGTMWLRVVAAVLGAPALASLQMKGVGGHQGLKKLIKKDPLAYITQPL